MFETFASAATSDRVMEHINANTQGPQRPVERSSGAGMAEHAAPTPESLESLQIAAFGILERDRKRLFRAAYRVVGTVQEAEDAVSEGELACVTHPRMVLDHPGYLYRTVMNYALDVVRKRKRFVNVESLPEVGVYTDGSTLTSADTLDLVCEYATAEQRKVVECLLGILAEQVHLGHGIESGFSIRGAVSETATRLGITPNAVKLSLHRLRVSAGAARAYVLPEVLRHVRKPHVSALRSVFVLSGAYGETWSISCIEQGHYHA